MLAFDSKEIISYSLIDGKKPRDYVLSTDLSTFTFMRSDSFMIVIYGLFFSSFGSLIRRLADIFTIFLSNNNPSKSTLKVFEQQITDFS